MTLPGIIRFEEAYFERIWGGTKLNRVLGRSTPAGGAIGEAWLVSDHREHESVVSEGPLAGRTLRQLLDDDAGAVLGSRAALTVHGRFPLLLKLLDSAEALSVQVHPDDAAAARLGEPDVGKTEMWYVLDADPESNLICGLHPGATPEAFEQGMQDGSIEELMVRFPAPPGTSVFVEAGTVHAIGPGMLLAEIQQNSDLTYRIYDWGRVDGQGKSRELHVDKALAVTAFAGARGGETTPLACDAGGYQREILSACRYFAAELLEVEGSITRETGGRSFHLVMATTGEINVAAGGTETTLKAGETAMVPGAEGAFQLSGRGQVLDYYVPDVERDIVAPLTRAGHGMEVIAQLGVG